jgi:hypothetical protein
VASEDRLCRIKTDAPSHEGLGIVGGGGEDGVNEEVEGGELLNFELLLGVPCPILRRNSSITHFLDYSGGLEKWISPC